MIYTDNANGDKATVMRFNDGNWEVVGSAGFSAGVAFYTTIAFDSNDRLYVAYADSVYGFSGIMMKFMDNNWVEESAGRFSEGQALSISIDFDSKDVPYVSFSDGNYNFGEDILSPVVAKIMSYDHGDFWTKSYPLFTEIMSSTSFALDSNDNIYMTYSASGDYGDVYGSKVIELKENKLGSALNDVGSSNFSEGEAFYTTIAFDSNDIPYVVYSDGENLKKATAKKYIEGVSWVDVGSGGFSTIEAEYISIAFDSSDILYVVYSDFVNGYKATVKKIETTVIGYIYPRFEFRTSFN